MGVFFGRAAVRGPPRVADAEGSLERVLAQNLFQIVQLAGGAPNFKRGGGKRGARRAAHGNARRVVAAVFEAAKPLDDDWNYFFWTDVADDAAHGTILSDRAGEGM